MQADGQVALLRNIEFVPGKAVLKESSGALLSQLASALLAAKDVFASATPGRRKLLFGRQLVQMVFEVGGPSARLPACLPAWGQI